MKALKTIGIILMALIAIVGIGGMLLPAHVTVSRNMAIKAPAYVIFPELNDLHNWANWSPWQQKDPNSKITYNGAPYGPGAEQSWDSENPEVGKGSMKITGTEENRKVVVELNFMENGLASSSFDLEPGTDGTLVTWTFESDMGMNPIARWVGFLMMDKWLGQDFDAGLSNLKSVAEAKPVLAVQVRPRTAQDYIGIKATVSEAEIGNTLGTLYGQMMEYAGKNRLQISGAPFAIVYSYSPERIEMEACLPVSKPASASGDIQPGRLEAGNNAEVDYYGKYEGSGVGHYAIDEWMKKENKQPGGAPYEVYETDPMSEPDTSKWLTRICYPLD